MGKVIRLRKRGRTERSLPTPSDADALRAAETKKKMDFLNSVYGKQVEKLLEKERSMPDVS
jgi:hypothetical protein